jgi:hypothetical protein
MIILNPIHFSPYEYGLDLSGLIGFALGSFFIVSILIFYYNRIPKSNLSKEEANNPIYLSKNELLHTTNSNDDFILVEKKTSIWVKLLAFFLIIIVLINPFNDLMGIEYFS